MRRRTLGLEALIAVLLAASAATTSADVPPPPDPPDGKRVPATIDVDWGPFADRVSTKHVVAKGETLRTIATQRLGDAARWKAIADANPVVAADPDKIAAGATLWLPSKASFEAPAADAGPRLSLAAWYDAFWTAWKKPRFTVLLGRATPGEIPDAVKPIVSLLLVPHEEAAPLLAVVDHPPPDIDRLVRDTHAVENYFAPDTLVHRDDPTVRVLGKYRLRGTAERRIVYDEERVRYDAEGRVVTQEWKVRAPSYEFRTPPPLEGSKGGAPPAPASASMAVVIAAPGNPPPGLPRPDEPPPPSAYPPARDAESTRWPATTGVIVAAGGAALVGALWFLRRRRVASGAKPPAPTPPST